MFLRLTGLNLTEIKSQFSLYLLKNLQTSPVSFCVWFSLFSSAVLLMASWCVQGLQVDVSPRRPLFRLGEHRQLVCFVHSCPTTPSISWSQLGDRPLTAPVTAHWNQSVMTFDPVVITHEGALLCKVHCAGETRQIKTSVQVYGESQTHTPCNTHTV